MKENIYKMRPFYSEKIWGWEKWNLSCHKDGLSTIENGSEKGKSLNDVLKFKEDFPIMIKVIKANDRLSVQVHPEDEYARKYEGDNGKTECWYIIEAEEDAKVILGVNQGASRQNIKEAVEKGEIEKYVNRISVKEGDFIFIPAGTVHAIEGGIKLIEAQQNSNITYRLYDWGRGRDIHLQKALDVIDYKGENGCCKVEEFTDFHTDYFQITKVDIKGTYSDIVKDQFKALTVIDGNGIIMETNNNGSNNSAYIQGNNYLKLSKEDTVYISKGVQYILIGKMKLLEIKV